MGRLKFPSHLSQVQYMACSGQRNVGRSDSTTSKKTGEEPLCHSTAPCSLVHKHNMSWIEATHSLQAQNKEKWNRPTVQTAYEWNVNLFIFEALRFSVCLCHTSRNYGSPPRWLDTQGCVQIARRRWMCFKFNQRWMRSRIVVSNDAAKAEWSSFFITIKVISTSYLNTGHL